MADKPIQVLLIEDNEGEVRLIEEMLSDVGNIFFILNRANRLYLGLEYIKARHPLDVILLNLMLPDSQGLDTLHRIHEIIVDIPIVILTDLDDKTVAIQAVREGAQDYLVKGHVDSGLLERALRYALERKRTETDLNMSLEKLRRITDQIIMIVIRTVDLKDPYTAGHQKRVSDLACSIAKCMELSGDQIEGLKYAASMHDIGKIGVPAEILSKPGALKTHEFSLVKTHPEAGYNILKHVDFPWPIETIVLQHHERMNGSGYPNGIFGKDILLEARILAVADVVEAMSTHRPYRAALGIDLALEEILKYRGILYDSEVVDACLLVFARDKFKFENISNA